MSETLEFGDRVAPTGILAAMVTHGYVINVADGPVYTVYWPDIGMHVNELRPGDLIRRPVFRYQPHFAH